MRNGPNSPWDVPRPAARLWLTLALGVLGAALFPGKEEYLANLFGSVQRAKLLAWMAAALAGVLLLRRVENVGVPKSVIALMGLAFGLSLTFFAGLNTEEPPWRAIFAWVCLTFLLLVSAGTLASGLQFRRGAVLKPWLGSLVRGAAVALTAPLLLFAARPAPGSTSFSAMHPLSRTGFALFPYVLAAGFALPVFGLSFRVRALWTTVHLTWLSFSLWAWLGCALLFLLSPRPGYPRTLEPDGLSKALKAKSLLAIAFVVMALVQLALLGEYVALLVLLIGGGLPCALLLLLVPWPEYPRLPKLGVLQQARKVRPLGTAVFLGMVLTPLVVFAYGPFLHVVWLVLEKPSFDRIHVGFVLDQPTIGKWFLISGLSIATVLPYVATARWMSDRSSRLGHWVFVGLATALGLCLLSIITMPFSWLLQYIHDMGWTRMRGYALTYGLLGYVVILGFFRWATWPRGQQECQPQQGGADQGS